MVIQFWPSGSTEFEKFQAKYHLSSSPISHPPLLPPLPSSLSSLLFLPSPLPYTGVSD